MLRILFLYFGLIESFSRKCIIVPGYLCDTSDYFSMQENLKNRGIDTSIVPLNIQNWLHATSKRSLTPILQKIDNSILKHDDHPITIIAHSASGWISRLYLSDIEYDDISYSGKKQVEKLITLGTPHTPSQIHKFYNASSILSKNLKIPCLAVAGKGFLGKDSSFTKHSYNLCFEDNVDRIDGDGVVPTQSAINLMGSEQLILGDKTLHHPYFPRIISNELHRASSIDETPWYGSSINIDQWFYFLRDI